jgi:DNA-binding Lrp family transcriptional regulator
VEEKYLPLAFVLINVETGTDEDVLRVLSKLANIKEAHMIYGVNDIIAKVEADSMIKLKEVVMEIRRLDSVSSTTTIVVMPEASYVT